MVWVAVFMIERFASLGAGPVVRAELHLMGKKALLFDAIRPAYRKTLRPEALCGEAI